MIDILRNAITLFQSKRLLFLSTYIQTIILNVVSISLFSFVRTSYTDTSFTLFPIIMVFNIAYFVVIQLYVIMMKAENFSYSDQLRFLKHNLLQVILLRIMQYLLMVAAAFIFIYMMRGTGSTFSDKYSTILNSAILIPCIIASIYFINLLLFSEIIMLLNQYSIYEALTRTIALINKNFKNIATLTVGILFVYLLCIAILKSILAKCLQSADVYMILNVVVFLLYLPFGSFTKIVMTIFYLKHRNSVHEQDLPSSYKG